ncbi:MAG: type IV secretory system conjugative DNA transfer family protein [Clostridiales bacterium]|nr:type IV secretory system conjugative DNA transfer family protein [Clostridiales bacterium]
MNYNDILRGYENTKLLHYKDMSGDFENTVAYDELHRKKVSGVLKASRYVNGQLLQTYSKQENHVGVIAATRLGKTTQYVVPTILSYAHQKEKRSMIISDPKGELYRNLSETLRAEGYNVKLFNFRDFLHSECWNPLTPIFKKYMRACNMEDEIEIVETSNGARNRFQGVVYESQVKLDRAVEQLKKIAMEDVGNEIDNLALRIISTEKNTDPYWEDSARDLLRAGIWAMLEDTKPTDGTAPITEETFSFRTLLAIMDSMRDGNETRYNDNGYFSSRKKDSRAYTIAKNCILENAPNTRKCIVSTFNAKMSVYKSGEVRLITSCNSFDFGEMVSDRPIAIFISYRDELKAHYQVISALIQSAYNFLIEYANNRPTGKLDVPFYFILDEFGNFPAITDFETVISACGGRNIFFILILQSYAQLNNVYGKDVAEIIRDNLNVHVFIGSNNPLTLKEFSTECGEFTRIAPVSALNGSKEEIETYQVETISLVPKSALSSLAVGECIVTEANCGYVLFSKLERYYQCKEFSNLPQAVESAYVCSSNPLDDKFVYNTPERRNSGKKFDFDF